MNFKRHQESHKSIKERIVFGCIEPDCDCVYSQKVHLRIHMQEKHNKELTEFRTMTAEESGKEVYRRNEKTREVTWKYDSLVNLETLTKEGKLKV